MSLVTGQFDSTTHTLEINVAGEGSLMIQLGTTNGVELPATIQISIAVDSDYIDAVGAADLMLLDGNTYLILNNSGVYSLPVAGLGKVKLSSGSYNGSGGAIKVAMRTAPAAQVSFGIQSVVYTQA